MKMKVAIISLALAVVLFVAVLYSAIFSINYIVYTDCRSVEEISRDSVLTSNLWKQLSEVIEEEALLENSDFATRAQFARDHEDSFGIDWEALGIPLDVATIEMLGKGLASAGFDPRLIDEIRVGYGYRDQLVFTIKDEPASSGPSELSVAQWSYDVSVECRHD